MNPSSCGDIQITGYQVSFSLQFHNIINQFWATNLLGKIGGALKDWGNSGIKPGMVNLDSYKARLSIITHSNVTFIPLFENATPRNKTKKNRNRNQLRQAPTCDWREELGPGPWVKWRKKQRKLYQPLWRLRYYTWVPFWLLRSSYVSR